MSSAVPYGRIPPYWVSVCIWSQSLFCECFDFDWLIIGNAVYLAFNPCPVNQRRASPTSPEDATPICSSILKIFSIDDASSSFELTRLSTIRTTPSFALIPTSCCPTLYSLTGVLHLVKPAIGRKDSNRPVVSHLILWLHYNSSRSSVVKNNRFVFLNPFSITSIF